MIIVVIHQIQLILVLALGQALHALAFKQPSEVTHPHLIHVLHAVVLAEHILIDVTDNLASLHICHDLLHVEDEAASSFIPTNQVAHLLVQVEVGTNHLVFIGVTLALLTVVA